MVDVSVRNALIGLGEWLKAANYAFTTVTPATHARVNARPRAASAQDLRDAFGWSRPFLPDLLPTELLAQLKAADLVEPCDGLWLAKVRYATLNGLLFVHSAYPTTSPDAVFFGPDTYRFGRLIHTELMRQPLEPPARILDIGCGAGPGGLVAAMAGSNRPGELVLADINPAALEYAKVNAALAGQAGVVYTESDLYASVGGCFDLIVANPPYLVDPDKRVYRHGGGALGTGLGERIVLDGLHRLTPQGRLVLYTGVPIVGGQDSFLAAISRVVDQNRFRMLYEELDPDVFGEELEMPAYAHTDRIAAVALIIQNIQ